MSLLKGKRVLDLTRVLAGPFTTMVLGDMGADVIKVERPGEGDETRSWGPPFCGSESAYFLSVNRNKRSIAIDLKQEQGIQLILDLAKSSDVLVENFIPGKMDELGIGYEHIKAINPKMVYCAISGYGPSGPYARRPGYDVIASSYSGLNYITGPENGDPCKAGVALTDMITGLYAHGAILAALLQRSKTGLGQKIDCNLLSSSVSVLVNVASSYLNAGVDGKRWGTAHASIVPYQAFETKDKRYLTIGATNNRQFENLCERIELPGLKEDERFSSNQMRVRNRSVLIKLMEEKFLSKSCGEWLTVLEGCKFPYGPINNMEQVFSDPQVLYNKSILEFHHSTAGKGIRVPGPAVQYSDHCFPPALPSPTLGQHTEEILRDILNMQDSKITALYQLGAVA